MSVEPLLDQIQTGVRSSFDRADRVLSFAEFLEDVKRRPWLHLRTAPQYQLSMIDWFGTREGQRIGREAVRFRVFDSDVSSGGVSSGGVSSGGVSSGGGSDVESETAEPLLAGQERAQQDIYNHLVAAAKSGKAEKMLLLHGPNGSGKTTIVECLMAGLESYSTSDEGQLLQFNWIFSDREHRLDRIGFEPGVEMGPLGELETYARLEEKDVVAQIPCELRDSPLFLIPRDQRREILERIVAECPPEARPRWPYDAYLDGELCQKCKRIFETLLVAYQGDWRRVMRHVQVERFFISKRYRVGAVSIEPQGNVDASIRAVQHEDRRNLPTLLRHVALYEPIGDIIDANRGVLEYSDFLKRPIDANKYLLTTCERGTVSLHNCIAYLDTVIVGTSNEKQLNLFKRSPDFSSFKGRIELTPVPYLLRYTAEARVYERQVAAYAGERHVTPHAAVVAALWAVLTRLRKPNPERYDGTLRRVVATLSPLEKAFLYDRGEVPARLSQEERQALRGGILAIREEYEDAEGEFEGIFGPEYEGRHGASPREMLTSLARAAEDPQSRCLTPMGVFAVLTELIRDAGLYDYLRIAPQDGYHDVVGFLANVQKVYLRWVTDEVYDSIELVDQDQYDRVFLEYFQHVKAFHTGETVHNPATDSYEPPNEELMESIERLLDLKDPAAAFRSQVITRIAAWSLDHPDAPVDYHSLFAEIVGAMREDFYRQRNRLLMLIEEDILKYDTDEFELLSEQDREQVERALENMRTKYGYCAHCARDVIAYVLKCTLEADAAAAAEGESAEADAEAGKGEPEAVAEPAAEEAS